MGEWAGELYLESRHIPDGKTKHSTEGHHTPEAGVSQLIKVVEGMKLTKQQHKGQE